MFLRMPRPGTEGTEPLSRCVQFGHLRITVLTACVLRIEWSATHTFENRPSLRMGARVGRETRFSVARDGQELRLETDNLTLTWRDDGRPPHADNLNIRGRVGGREMLWRPGDPDEGNLGGTTRTLDNVSGRTTLEPGLLSRAGWTLIDDSGGLVFDRAPAANPSSAAVCESDDLIPWVAARADPAAIDWYFFAYGHDCRAALRDFAAIAGRAPLPPRYVFGAWWSRYWAYSDAELRALVAEFRAHDVPLDVLVIDMDWHLDGWTGYTWNPAYFPDPPGFLAWAHSEGLRVALNLHPADGVGRHESAFADVCRNLGLDPATTERVPFDCTDPRFISSYFRRLHHPLEKQGVDFWWMDWQQGAQTSVAGLDPLFWLNYLHWADWERDAGAKHERPLIFSRWGGLGNHRYPIGFSGDTYCDWRSLAFQPEFTATAGNVGYGYWSHDIGGHQPGPVDPELYVRWLQWGALSPVLRTHTTKRADAERRIWAFEPHIFAAAKRAWLLRYELLPYLYTAARLCYDELLPLCRPLYYEWPKCEEAYARRDEYLFGDDLLVAPVTEPANPQTGIACVRVWLPPGQWRNWFSGKLYSGPGEACLRVPLSEIPLFARAGAVIPVSQPRGANTPDESSQLSLLVFPGGDDATFDTPVYEDDGLSRGYERGECAWTPIRCRFRDGVASLTIGPTAGEYPGMPRRRGVEIRLCPGFEISDASVHGGALEVRNDQVVLPVADISTPLEIELHFRADRLPRPAIKEEEIYLRLELGGCSDSAAPALSVVAEAALPCCVEIPGDQQLRLSVHSSDAPLQMSAPENAADAGGDMRIRSTGRWPLNYPLQTRHISAVAMAGNARVTIAHRVFPGINRWYVRGPYGECEAQEAMRDFSRLKARGIHAPENGWRIVDRPLDARVEPLERFAPDFTSLFGDTVEPIIFAAAILESSATRAVRLRVQSGDAVTVWLNGQMLHKYVTGRPWAVLHDHVGCELRAGANVVLLQVMRGRLGWSCALEVESPEGAMLDDVLTG